MKEAVLPLNVHNSMPILVCIDKREVIEVNEIDIIEYFNSVDNMLVNAGLQVGSLSETLFLHHVGRFVL